MEAQLRPLCSFDNVSLFETVSMSTDRYSELIQHLEAMKEDFEKFYVKGKNAAGTRLRKSLQELRRLAQEIRTEIQAIKVARKQGS
jgi:hypothetical protein